MLTKDAADEWLCALEEYIDAKISHKVTYPESGDYLRVMDARQELYRMLTGETPEG